MLGLLLSRNGAGTEEVEMRRVEGGVAVDGEVCTCRIGVVVGRFGDDAAADLLWVSGTSLSAFTFGDGGLVVENGGRCGAIACSNQFSRCGDKCV